MDLLNVRIEGIRRFRDPSNLALNGKLIALLGPNEAGKSSVIRAIQLLDNDAEIPTSDVSRYSHDKTQIVAKFFLTQDELIQAELKVPSWLIVTKNQNGPRNYEIEPCPKDRDLTNRHKTPKVLERVRLNRRVIKDLANSATSTLGEMEQISAQLASEEQDLPPKLISLIRKVAEELENNLSTKVPKYAQALSKNLIQLASSEEHLCPNKFALNTLKQNLPRILEFTQADRGLQGEYNLPAIIKNTPPALANLAKVAELDLSELNTAVTNSDQGRIQTIQNAANHKLQSAFFGTWSQSSIEVSMNVDGPTLHILIIDNGKEYSAVRERSDGLRQFVALQSFTTCQRIVEPILLIDEAEVHLHYDAQADLVQMLTRQSVTPKVIYSTHSAGCLPEDLGVGVRMIRSQEQEMKSEIQNKFWAIEDIGFSPLLIGMGASTLAFFPTRCALVVEGAADMLLLPTLLREASSNSYLGLQIVSGLANASKAELPSLQQTGTNVAFFVDSDPGGETLRSDLKNAGVSENRIFNVKCTSDEYCTLEDLIDPNLFIRAVNELLNRYKPGTAEIALTEIKGHSRAKKLKDLLEKRKIEPISKVDIANVILDLIFANPETTILDSNYASELARIYEELQDLLQIDRPG